MILIGQYDSSFVRRVAIAMRLYNLPFEHRPWSVFGDAEKIRPLNPLGRVPTLVLDNGEVLVESHSIIDYLDSLMPPEARLFPQEQPHRHRAMKIASLATGLADRGVSLFYQVSINPNPSSALAKRLTSQMVGVLEALEVDLSKKKTPCWFGDRIGHADIAVAAALRHQSEGHPQIVKLQNYPALTAFCARLEALPVFQEISQPLIPPAG